MSEFVDSMLLSLSDPEALTRLLDPPADTGHTRIRSLIDAMYAAPFARIHEVRKLATRNVELARPLFPLRENRGSWAAMTPDYGRADLHWDEVDRGAPIWVDLVADLSVTLVLEVDTGEVESILVRQIEDIVSLDDFRSRFRIFDLDAFLAKHHITTVEDLRERYSYLLTEIKMRQPPAFDPADPKNEASYELGAAITIRDSLEVVEALRAAKLSRVLLERTASYRTQAGVGELEVLSPYASVVVFPQAALTGTPFTDAGLRALFAREGVVAIFASAQ